MALIDKDQIRAEIKRQIKSLEKDWLGARAARWAFEEILKYIDSLPEQPVEGLEEEVKRYYFEHFYHISGEQLTLSVLTNIARHFAEWGAEHNSYK